jgi:type II secretory pathway pseudopilin PulG
MFLIFKKKLKSFTLIETVFAVLMIGIVMSVTIGTFITFQSSQKKLNTLVSAYDNLRVILDLIFRSVKVGYGFKLCVPKSSFISHGCNQPYMIEKFDPFNSDGATTTDLVFVRGDGKCVRISYFNENIFFYSTTSNTTTQCESDKGTRLNLDYVKIKEFSFKNIGCEDFGNGLIGPRRIEIYLKADINLTNATKTVEILTAVTPKTISCK